jgi:hypothetical protein
MRTVERTGGRREHFDFDNLHGATPLVVRYKQYQV